MIYHRVKFLKFSKLIPGKWSNVTRLFGVIYQRIALLYSSLMLLLCVVFSVNVVASEVQVITHTPTKNMGLLKTHIKAIYLGQQTQWPDGSKITVFILNAKESTHQKFIREVLGLYPYQFRRRWQKLSYSGFGVKPTVVKNTEEMLMKIATVPGAIGYVGKKVIRKGVQYVQIN